MDLYLATAGPQVGGVSILDTITLIDVTDGDDATIGSVEAVPTLH